MLKYDKNYTNTFHSPGIEPWITGFLEGKKPESILDLGCGLGFTAFLLKLYLDNFKYLVGLDVSAGKLPKAKKTNLYDDLVAADARWLPFRSGVFDLVVSTEVIHGLPADVLNSIEGTLREDGSVMLALPSLPEGVTVKNLISRGYSIYRYLLRGLVLVELKNYRFLLAANTRSLRMFKVILSILMPLFKATEILEKGYFLAFK